jgi:hypothetical protein
VRSPFLFVLVWVLVGACRPAPAPDAGTPDAAVEAAPVTPAVDPAVAESTYETLYEAGCYPYDDAGAEDIAASAGMYPWLDCLLFEAGTVTSCSVPCTVDDAGDVPLSHRTR